MGRGTIVKTKIGNTGGRTDRYEYTRRHNLEKAQMNLDKLFIAKFKNIKIKYICEKLNIPVKQAQVLHLKPRDVHRIKVELDRLIREMYNIETYKGYDLSKNYSYSKWDKQRAEDVEKGTRVILEKNCYDELTEE